jgi:hypothetical protein
MKSILKNDDRAITKTGITPQQCNRFLRHIQLNENGHLALPDRGKSYLLAWRMVESKAQRMGCDLKPSQKKDVVVSFIEDIRQNGKTSAKNIQEILPEQMFYLKTDDMTKLNAILCCQTQTYLDYKKKHKENLPFTLKTTGVTFVAAFGFAYAMGAGVLKSLVAAAVIAPITGPFAAAGLKAHDRDTVSLVDAACGLLRHKRKEIRQSIDSILFEKISLRKTLGDPGFSG